MKSDISKTNKTQAVTREDPFGLKGDLDDLISRASTLSESDLEQAKTKLMEKIASSKRRMNNKVTAVHEEIYHQLKGNIEKNPMKALAVAVGFSVFVKDYS